MRKTKLRIINISTHILFPFYLHDFDIFGETFSSIFYKEMKSKTKRKQDI